MEADEIAARLEINEVLARYCHALDRRDWPAFRNVFTEDATLDFSAFGGPKGNVAELEAFLRPVLDSLAGSQHMTSTVMVDFDDDGADVRSTAIVPMTAADGDGNEHTVFNGLWYEDRLRRTPAGWRIQSRRQVRGWVFSPA